MRIVLRLLLLSSLVSTGCEEDEGADRTAEAPRGEAPDPEPAPAEVDDEDEPVAPEAEPPPLADEGFEPPCLTVATTRRGDATIPPQLAELTDESHADSELVRVFARRGHAPPTATGHQPRGHLFRWTLREAIAEPRQSFHNDEFRARLGRIAGGVPLQEDFQNRQVRTLEARLRTSGPVEQVLTVLNSKAEGQPSTASQSCVDHGPLPGLTVGHFARWGWLPAALTPLAERLPQARVQRWVSDPVSLVLRADPSVNEALATLEGLAATDEGETVRIELPGESAD